MQVLKYSLIVYSESVSEVYKTAFNWQVSFGLFQVYFLKLRSSRPD